MATPTDLGGREAFPGLRFCEKLPAKSTTSTSTGNEDNAMQIVSNRTRAAAASSEPISQFYFISRYGKVRGSPDICDFTFGNPHDMPLSGVVDAIRHHALPQDKDWFAYKASEPHPQAFLAERLRAELALSFEPEDIALTNGAFAAISVAFRLLLDAGEEVVFSTPAWFSYEPMLLAADLVPRKVPLRGARFDLDLDAIEAAITPRTGLVIVNTPHNPTGRIYEREDLVTLAACLDRASQRIGRRVFLLSDEPYRRIRFDARAFTSPAAVYPWTVISYSFGKVLLAPGQRVGYLALSPLMPSEDRLALRNSLFAAQMALGWCFPNAVMQYAVPDLDRLGIDMAALAAKRDRLTETLEAAAFEVLQPEGTFYMFCRWPGEDHERLWNALADRGVYVLPGATMGTPMYFRICLTASSDMVERSLTAFAELGNKVLS
jgi:aspartate aminotransferase